jgi:hypothetical protein
MDVVDLLTRALAAVPDDIGPDAAAKVADAREYLDEHNEWGLALDVLADIEAGWWPPPSWWELLIEAAELMQLPESVRVCHWRRAESLHGIIRAEITLTDRKVPAPGRGVWRPVWEVGGQRLIAVALIENAPEIPPGGTGTVRLRPLTPELWLGVQPGQTIVVYEGKHPGGTGSIIEVRRA